MQNWNQWQLSAGAVTTAMPQPPVGYAAPGADPMAMMQAYMQYYNQPAPSGYTAEQWAAAQQQNWAQWQQWQQQYQQWQAQYGEKYQETMKQMSAQGIGLASQAPPLPNVQPPPLPKEDSKPPLPPNTMNAYQFTSMPPPHQNNLPLFPVKQSMNSAISTNMQNCPQNPPLPPIQPPLPPENSSSKDNVSSGKRGSSSVSEPSSAKKLKVEDEELTEAEKTFDAQFKQWEEKFNKWKQQNANHPDKTQYKQYEAKWTSWREKLIERREQMRKKREHQKQAAAKAEAEKSKSLPGDDKILNILSSTENQGLINNLLGIGKTLGLTGKQNTNIPPPPPPPPPQTTMSNVQSMTVTPPSQSSTSQGMNMSSNMTSTTWNSQQWSPQYNMGMNVPNFPGFQSMTGVPPPPFGAPPTQMPPPNFTQPPPNFPNATPNFSQPPPGFVSNDARQSQSHMRPPIQPNMQGRLPFGPNDSGAPDMNLLGSNERTSSSGSMNMNFGLNDHNRPKDISIPPDRFSRDGINKSLSDQQGDQFRTNDTYGPRSENYKLNDDRKSDSEQFRREDRKYQEHGNNQFNLQKMNFNAGTERFGPRNDCFGQGNDHFGPTGERFGQGNDRFGPNNDRFGPGNNRFGSGSDRFGSINDRFGQNSGRFGGGNERTGPGNERFGNNKFGQGNESSNERFAGNSDRFGPNNEHFASSNDRFNRNPLDRSEQKDTGDTRRDNFSNNSRSFDRNNQYQPPNELAPELKKLMEKRRAAMDVFKPSFLDSDKNSNASSLSESFKKIAGDSPFAIKNSMDFMQKECPTGKGNNNVGPRGLSNCSPAGPGNFKIPGADFRPRELGDFKPQGGPDFAPRGPVGFGIGNHLFDFHEPPPDFRGTVDNFGRGMPNSVDFDQRIGKEFERRPNSSPQQMQNFLNADLKPDTKNNVTMDKINVVGENAQEVPATRNESIDTPHTVELKPTINEQDVDKVLEKEHPDDFSMQKDIPLLEKPPWVSSEFSEESLLQKDVNANEEGNDTPANFEKPEQLNPNTGNQKGEDINAEDTKDLLKCTDEDSLKKSEALPFMGENDPKPEDLNMEPPPELPNLGPVSADLDSEIITNDPLPRVEEPFDAKGHSSRPPPNIDHFDPRGTFDNTFGPRGMQFRPPFGPRGPNDGRFPTFEPRGPAFPFNPTGPPPHLVGPRPPNDGQFGPCGPDNLQFGPRGFNDGQFGPKGPNDEQFGPRGLNDGQFGPRGPNYRQFGLYRPNDAPFDNRVSDDIQFRPRMPNEGQFGFTGPNDRFFGSRRPNDGLFGQRGPNDNTFDPRGVNDGQFNNRGLKDAPFGQRNFNGREFDSQGPNDGPFGPQGDRYFEQRGPINKPTDPPFISRNRSEEQFNNRPLFGVREPGDLRQRGQFDTDVSRDNMKSGSSLSAFKPDGLKVGDLNVKYLERNVDSSSSDTRGDGGSERTVAVDGSDKMQMEQQAEQGQPFGSSETQKPGWRQSYAKNSFGDTDQRYRRDPVSNEKSLSNKNESHDQSVGDNTDQRTPFGVNKLLADKTRSDKGVMDSVSSSSVGDFKAGYGDSSAGTDYGKFNSSNAFIKRSADHRQTQVRCPVGKEFCIEKQFNYNHGGTAIDKKFVEHIPLKVIDYAHTSRTPIQDHLAPVQCFDYGHGNLKPVVPDLEVPPKKDFRNWEENEQNLKEYTERIRRYEYFVGRTDSRHSTDYSQRKDNEIPVVNRRSDRERRDRGKERGEDMIFDRMSDKDQDNRFPCDKGINKERTQERCDASQRKSNKENEKDEDRSKGNINWQDTTSKNNVESKSQETSISDTQHNVLESAPKTLELAKTPNCTMVDDLLCPPGRQNRPPKIAIILRGPPGSGKSFVAKLIKDKEVEQGGSAPRILSLDDYFLVEKEVESKDDNGKKVTIKEMVYEYEEAMEQSYITSLIKAFKKNITDGFFNFIILDCINEKITDYEEMWSFAKTKGFKVYVCEMEMDLQICLKRNIHNRTEEEINRIIDYFEPTPSYHQKLDVNSMLQEQAIEEVQMEDTEESQEKTPQLNEDSQDSQEDLQDTVGVSKWERMEAEDKLDRLDGLAKKKNEGKVQTMKDFLQVPDYYNMEDTSGKKRVRWADLEERKEQEKMRAVGFVVGHTNWDRMMDPTKGGSALTRTKFFSLS